MGVVSMRAERRDPASIGGDFHPQQGLLEYPHQVGSLIQIGSNTYEYEPEYEVAGGFKNRLKKLGKKVSKPYKKLGRALEKVGKSVAPLAMTAAGGMLGGPMGAQMGGQFGGMLFGGGGGADAPMGFENLVPGVMPGMPILPNNTMQQYGGGGQEGGAGGGRESRVVGGGGVMGNPMLLVAAGLGLFLVMRK